MDDDNDFRKYRSFPEEIDRVLKQFHRNALKQQAPPGVFARSDMYERDLRDLAEWEEKLMLRFWDIAHGVAPSSMDSDTLEMLEEIAPDHYSLIGETRRKIIRERRAKKDVDGADLRRKQSAASLRTGNYRDVVAYVEASLENASASDQAWARALKRGEATERWRRQAAKDGVLLRWFHRVRRSVGALTGLYDATVVWGCKVKATGKGNLSAPTERSAHVASRVAGWKVVRGDEYNTSKLSFIAPHSPNQSPRFRGVKRVVRRRLDEGESVRNRVRDGWVEGLSAKRILRRVELDGKSVRQIGVKCVKQPNERTAWEYEGTSGDSAKVKAEMKAERLAAGSACRYVRGLRVFIQDQGTTKFVDRDVNGSVNIGLLWISDNIQGRSRPQVFVRQKESVAKNTAEITRMSLPAQNSG